MLCECVCVSQSGRKGEREREKGRETHKEKGNRGCALICWQREGNLKIFYISADHFSFNGAFYLMVIILSSGIRSLSNVKEEKKKGKRN